MADKIYVPGSAKEIETQYGPLLKLSFKVEDMVAFLQEHQNAKGWVNINVSRRKSEGKYGETHNMLLDTWQPTPKAQPRQQELPDDSDVPV